MELRAYGKAGAIAEEVFSSIRTVFSYNGQSREEKRLVNMDIVQWKIINCVYQL
jgi:hypothetical protein